MALVFNLFVSLLLCSSSLIDAAEESQPPSSTAAPTTNKSTRKCPANAHWEECSDTATGCYKNCYINYKMNLPSNNTETLLELQTCTRICGNGCDCDAGYVYRYGSTGDCVLPKDCPTEFPKCGANAHWEACSQSAHNCANNCANYFTVYPSTFAHCKNLTCTAGCQCDSGYIFETGQSGNCISASKCPNFRDARVVHLTDA